jgi:hypothetical protein
MNENTKILLGCAGVIGAVLVGTACTPDSTETSGAPLSADLSVADTYTTEPAIETVTADDSTGSASVFELWALSEGYDPDEASMVAQAACITLRDVTYPSDPLLNSALYGMAEASVDHSTSGLTIKDAARIIGAGATVWCPEFDGAWN